MNKFTKIIITLFFGVIFAGLSSNQAQAASCEEHYNLGIEILPNDPLILDRDGSTVTVTVTDPSGQLNARFGDTATYKVRFGLVIYSDAKTINNSATWTKDLGLLTGVFAPNYNIVLIRESGIDETVCEFDDELEILKTSLDGSDPTCVLSYSQVSSYDNQSHDNPSCLDSGKSVAVQIDNFVRSGSLFNGSGIIKFADPANPDSIAIINISNGSGETTILAPTKPDTYSLLLEAGKSEGICEVGDYIKVMPICDLEEQENQVNSIPEFNLCKFVKDDGGKCGDCVAKNGVWTALGCIRFTPTDFIKDFMSIALGIAGGIALLLMIYGAFLITASAGDPKKAEQGKEIITGTIAGLLFIIFSVVLLKLIGVEIFQLPGISKL